MSVNVVDTSIGNPYSRNISNQNFELFEMKLGPESTLEL
jgi:hypothetical protein